MPQFLATSQITLSKSTQYDMMLPRRPRSLPLSSRSRLLVVPLAMAKKKSQKSTRKKEKSVDVDPMEKEDSVEIDSQDSSVSQAVSVDEDKAVQEVATAASSSQSDAGHSTAEEALSVDEIAERMSALRSEKEQAKTKDGFFEGVLEEIGLIKWPTFQSALLNTLLVVAIVGGASAILFSVNTLLTELSKEIYGKL